ncbi:14330_t:CDS:2 [Entrophospora sp. SA101]|nr:2639_t:CDS:2 [Entrophospora sp. SA101]CAJ0838208.1 14330_t:CDS:2 [Entrophospora sp. SA101]
MKAGYTCNYLHNSGETCNRPCIRSEGCRHHYNSKKRIPCTDCGKPTASACGRCGLHKRGFYMIRYVNKLREKANIVKENFGFIDNKTGLKIIG